MTNNMDKKYIEHEIDEALKMFPHYNISDIKKERIVKYFSEIEKRPLFIQMIQLAVLFATLTPNEETSEELSFMEITE